MQVSIRKGAALWLASALFFMPASMAFAKKTCCPKCSTPCVLKVEEGSEEKHCWKVKSKSVCIPRVRFSWQWPGDPKDSCCAAGCDQNCDGGCGKCLPPLFGKSREVCVLEKHTYECPKCKYTWEPADCGTGTCATNTCATDACASKTTTQPANSAIATSQTLSPALVANARSEGNQGYVASASSETQVAAAQDKQPRSLFALPVKVSLEAKKFMSKVIPDSNDK